VDTTLTNPTSGNRGLTMRTHAHPTNGTAAHGSRTGSVAPTHQSRSKGLPFLLRLQRGHGNRFVQRTLKAMLQAKLAVNRPGDRYEQEADRVADAALRLTDAVVQRKCTCGSGTHEPCEQCAGAAEPLVQRRLDARAPAGSLLATSAPQSAPPSVETALAAPGRPLPDEVRREMEVRLGYDFCATRVHDDVHAQESARQVSARAYTVGSHIVFGSGQFRPGTGEGRRLLAHELVHVMQQSGRPAAENETGVSQVSVAGPAVQRATEDSWGTIGDAVLEGALSFSLIPSPLRSAAAASVRGFTAEAIHQFSSNKGAISDRLKELRHLDNLKSLFGGYYGGLLAGIASPLTGLFDVLVFADRLRVFVNHLVADAANRFAELLDTGRELVAAISGIVAKAKEEVSKLIAHPLDLIIALVTDQGPSRLEAAANKAGHDAAIAAAAAISKRFSPETQAPEQRQEEAPLAQAEAKIEQFKESLFSTPWSKVGYDIGYAVGAVAVNMLLLVFSGGVGNALTKLGSVLGELGGVLGSAGRLIAVLGRAITFVEEAINAVINVALKPLQPLLRALEPHFQKLVLFLRKLLGVAEKESAEAAAAAAKATAAAAKPKPPALHAPTPHPHAPTALPRPSAPAPHMAGPRQVASPHAQPPTAHPGAHPQAQTPHPRAQPHVETPHPGAQPHVETPSTKAPSPAHKPQVDANEAKALERTRHVEHPDPGMIDDELKAVKKLESRPPTEPGYVEERVLPNGHVWRKNADGAWCRFSAKPPDLCVTDLEAFLAKGGTVKKIPAKPTPEPKYTAVPRHAESAPAVEGHVDQPPYRGRGSKQMSKDFAHDLGVQQGHYQARKDKLTWYFDNPRGVARTTPGLDSIFKDAEGNFVIVEFKGGAADLKPGQMSNAWVNRELKLLEKQLPPGHPVVKELRAALNAGQLKGRTYLTRIDPVGKPLATEVVDHGTFFPI
jgi:hypothetical protein